MSFTKLFALLMVAAWLGCARSPSPVFYALSARPGAALSSRALTIEVRRPGLPSYLDRPHIVRRVTAEQLSLDADEHWGAPLQEMVTTTLVDELSERLPACTVFSEAGAISPPPDARVEIEVSRFELNAAGAVELQAEVAVSWSDAPQGTHVARYVLHSQPASTGTADLVASMSVALGKLSDSIAQAVLRGSASGSQAAPERLESSAR
jgi:uncharacterized lipoprotein YmbA